MFGNFFMRIIRQLKLVPFMRTHQLEIRVRYGETDQMGYVYYGNYAQFFEMGRVEWLRHLGVSYKDMETSGIMLPVLKLETNYLKPAKYDELLTLKTTLKKLPGVKIEFDYELFNEQNELLTTAYTSLVFIDMKKNKPTRCPDNLLKKLNLLF